MSKVFSPTLVSGYLYRGVYRVNKNYRSYDYDHLSSLVKWWEYLDHSQYRYTFLVFTLSYNKDDIHNSSNITSFISNIRKNFKINGFEVPLHSVWKLEYRKLSSECGASGYHYHVFLCFNREISPSTTQLSLLVKKYWKWGDVHISATHLTPKTLQSDGRGWPLDFPIKNTQTEHRAGVFHHLSYLAKNDPEQVLPSEYNGDSFKASQCIPDRLIRHPSIIKRKNKIRLIQQDCIDFEDAPYMPVSLDIDFKSEVPF
ncbi:inovirus-type Gp2 protein [Shewanella sp. SG41-3]|uniref:rolling circle replication-associated protein n=1 Tax=Shewanella sp. SG41-3 TaxID=2760977 RepID=UPI001602DE0A|nr:inovirus-type Gp2 protein [Shewanella sp. SG41-3]MBB1475918.1 inovirus-type Gp2 protein [Shewanella sp. SG41-3]